jgi:hypothetical protein
MRFSMRIFSPTETRSQRSVPRTTDTIAARSPLKLGRDILQ